MTTSDTIRIMLIKCKLRQVDICKELNCSPQAFSNKMVRSSWTVSDLASIVNLCRGKLLIELLDGSVLPLDPDNDDPVTMPKRNQERKNKPLSDSLSKKKAASSRTHQKKAKQKNCNSPNVIDENTPDTNKNIKSLPTTQNNPSLDIHPEKTSPYKQETNHKQEKHTPTECLSEEKSTRSHSRKETQIDGQQNIFDLLDVDR